MMYDTFLSYHSSHAADARRIYDCLSASGVRVFFDEEEIKPGTKFQKRLEDGIQSSSSLVVLIGSDGSGPWQNDEFRSFHIISNRLENSEMPIIPVFLGKKVADPCELPVSIPAFLYQYHSVYLHDEADNAEEMFKIIGAIPRHRILSGPFERPLVRHEQDALNDKSVSFYEENAERYFERWRNDLPVGPLETFKRSVRDRAKESRVLDAGCGPGHHSCCLAEAGFDVVGMDRCSSFIKMAKRQGNSRCRFVIGDMRSLHSSFGEKNYFDAIWSCGSCVHIAREYMGRQLDEFIAFLKPGGLLGISLQIGAPSVIQKDGRFFERYENEDEVLRMLDLHGLQTDSYAVEIKNKSTTADGVKVKKWIDVLCQAPSKKKYLPYV